DLLFLFTHHAPPPTSTLSLHDALPICPRRQRVELRPIAEAGDPAAPRGVTELLAHRVAAWALDVQAEGDDQSTLLRGQAAEGGRSEEHTSELQSRFDLVCRLLLEKKKQ